MEYIVRAIGSRSVRCTGDYLFLRSWYAEYSGRSLVSFQTSALEWSVQTLPGIPTVCGSNYRVRLCFWLESKFRT